MKKQNTFTLIFLASLLLITMKASGSAMLSGAKHFQDKHKQHHVIAITSNHEINFIPSADVTNTTSEKINDSIAFLRSKYTTVRSCKNAKK